MRFKPVIPFLLIAFIILFVDAIQAEENVRVESFSPQGTVKGVRQVSVRFSEQMVPFGDPSGMAEPFEIKCAEKGSQMWADGKNWLYNFERDLPAGTNCEFTLKPDLKTLAGTSLAGQRNFAFSTGGAAILRSYPFDGTQYIEEGQAFILQLDSPAIESSVIENVFFSVPDIMERIEVEILPADIKKDILNSINLKNNESTIAIKAKRNFPENTRVTLVWGKGVKSASGIPTEQDQVFNFKTRGPFRAEFNCERENPQAACLPITEMRLSFSAPVAWTDTSKIVLKGPGSMVWKAQREIRKDDAGEEEKHAEEPDKADAPQDKFVQSVFFQAPYPQDTEFRLELPAGLEDDSGRKLSNADKFPLAVKTGDMPPLAKFASRFGILELNAQPVLPLTVRNIEPAVLGRLLKQGGISGLERLKGKIFSIVKGADRTSDEIIDWLIKVQTYDTAQWEFYNPSYTDKRAQSVFTAGDEVRQISIPRPEGTRAFEVIGIPLKEPGFYVVEIESPILGESLLGKKIPMYVPAAVLVTNLSVHFKWGRESSLVWVTTLNEGKPVKDADIEIKNCSGKVLWAGKTDSSGIARMGGLSEGNDSCQGRKMYGTGLFVMARSGEDVSFVHSDWNEGIEAWRFQLPQEYYHSPVKAHTVFDRTLLRAGERVQMKHLIRKHTIYGFSKVPQGELPKKITIVHYGSGQKYEFPLTWNGLGASESAWDIPKDAKLGEYGVILSDDKQGDKGFGYGYYGRSGSWNSGSFRVEEFKVPLMKGNIQPPTDPLVAPSSVKLDLTLKYLAGGGASGANAKLRSQLKQRYVRFADFEEFTFANGGIREGLFRSGVQRPEQVEGEDGPRSTGVETKFKSIALTLDASGSARAEIPGLPHLDKPTDLVAELEFSDPNGEVQTVTSRVPLWPAYRLVGIKPDSWVHTKDSLKFQMAVVDTLGNPVPGAEASADIFEKKFYTHRKRLVGGFYAYEHVQETKKLLKNACNGKTNEKGILLCETKPSRSGELIIQAVTTDAEGNRTVANQVVWVAGEDDWWFEVADSDRIDLLPEKKRYEPGEVAKFQVRMPFRKATALVTVEREGVIDAFVKEISGKEPVVKVLMKGNYSPNVFVSALVVRGRVGGVKPTAMVDLGRPAYKLGIQEINVGWKSHELKVKVSPEKDVYKVRERASVKLSVRTTAGKLPPAGTEVSVAAVDEGLLELMDNKSWDVLSAMMGRRPYEMQTSTAQMHVIGKRHFGLKALPHGGGGGNQPTRELFDTLLLWKGRVQLDSKGEAIVEFPLNDSITSFRIAAVATGGAGLFGSGYASIRTAQDLMLFSGFAPIAREGDSFDSVFTVRNAGKRVMDIEVSGKSSSGAALEPELVKLNPGESREMTWNVKVPVGVDSITYQVEAREKEGAYDSIKVTQKVMPAVPVRTYQATITQLDRSYSLAVQRPADSVPGKGGVKVTLKKSLAEGMSGVTEYMRLYPYICLEQRVSRAIALKDTKLWNGIAAEIPAYLDSDGLAKYFPSMQRGSDVLTAYIISVSSEAGRELPANVKKTMTEALKRFVQGTIIRGNPLPTADLSIRKLAAIEALSRLKEASPEMLSSISIEPNLWPTSAVLDWFNILRRVDGINDREQMQARAEQILRSRLNFQGTTMGFSTGELDDLWWLMVSTDTNAVRFILSMTDSPQWKEDMPRLVRGALARQRKGAWDLTTANAWGVLAFDRFSTVFEKVPVTGSTKVSTSEKSQAHDWASSGNGVLDLKWAQNGDTLSITHEGEGMPWTTVQSLAAIPLKEPLSSGYSLKKTITPVQQKVEGRWSRGDVYRVRIDITAQADMTWVAVNDPVPAGATILGTGLGRDSALSAVGEKLSGNAWPAYTERSFEAVRSYYEFMPKGSMSFEYTIRLNQAGRFNLPTTRVEALYSPEMLGELPNADFVVE
jgi:uncharacterized protein YfaS (alpha-2-macroglobulin family)